MKVFWLASFTLFRREFVRFIRQKDRVIGALGVPLVFWFLIGSGLQNAFQGPRALQLLENGPRHLNYLQYFFPGTIVLIVLFTAIFSTISIIEDRAEGFLQGVLVSPIPRSALVFGKLLGGAALATAQGILFLVIVPFLGIRLHFLAGLLMATNLFIVAFGLTGLGFLFAWSLNSSQGFHAIMNLVLMPMWILSGALFPVTGAPGWLKAVMMLNPLTYSLAVLQKGLFHPENSGLLDSFPFCLSITFIFSSMMYIAAVMIVRKK